MMTFTIPTNNLESEISALVAELQAKKETLKQSKQLEKQATATIEKLAATVEALKSMPEQLEALRANVLALFPQSVDNTKDEQLPIVEAVEALQRGDFMVEVPKVEAAPEPEPASVEEVEPNQPKGYTELRMLSDDVGYLVNQKGEILAGYAGFSQKRKAEAKGKELSELLRMGYQVRTEGDHSKRLPHKYELRLLDINMSQLQRLADELTPKAEPQPTTQPTVELPEFTLIRDTSEDALLGEIWEVRGIGGNRKFYGKVRQHLMHPGKWLHSQQRDTIGFDSKEDAAKALVKGWVHDRELHNQMNQAIASKYLAG